MTTLAQALEQMEYYSKDPISNECPSPENCALVVAEVARLVAKYEAPPVLHVVTAEELAMWNNRAKAQACIAVRVRLGCTLRDAMHSLRAATSVVSAGVRTYLE